MLKKVGCLSATQAQWNRREFIGVGSLGFLGIHLSQALRLEAALADPARPAPGESQGLHSGLAGRRTQPGGHLGSQAQ